MQTRAGMQAASSSDVPTVATSSNDSPRKSQGFRHELRLRVASARFGTEPFKPIYNATFDLRTCVQCGAMAPKMKHCIGCKWARYCDRECQKANWRTHRTECCPDHALPTGISTISYSCSNSTRIGGPAHRQLLNISTTEGTGY